MRDELCLVLPTTPRPVAPVEISGVRTAIREKTQQHTACQPRRHDETPLLHALDRLPIQSPLFPVIDAAPYSIASALVRAPASCPELYASTPRPTTGPRTNKRIHRERETTRFTDKIPLLQNGRRRAIATPQSCSFRYDPLTSTLHSHHDASVRYARR